MKVTPMLYIIFHNNRVYLDMARHLLTAGGISETFISCDEDLEGGPLDAPMLSGFRGVLIAAMSEEQYQRLTDLRRMLEDGARKASEPGVVCGISRGQLAARLCEHAWQGQGGVV